MKVLITGGGGFIGKKSVNLTCNKFSGSHAVVETLEAGHEVVVLDGK